MLSPGDGLPVLNRLEGVGESISSAANKGPRGRENPMPTDLLDKSETTASSKHVIQFSPLVLAESLIMLAQEADRAGYRRSASRLIVAAHAALDENAPDAVA